MEESAFVSSTEQLIPTSLRRVLVVGAGVAGLQTCRQLLKLGLNVLVLDSNDDLGGVWVRNYVGFGLQVPWKLYQFPEFPWPKDLQPSSEYPTGQEVQEYIRAYAARFDLRRHIRFSCKLLRLRWCHVSRTWDALYADTVAEKFYKVNVDYAVMCSGIYSQPYIPDYEGADSYAGIQLHAKDFTDLTLARGRRVVIVGAGKTGLDCVSSLVAANTAASVTLLYRQAHWPVPRRMLGTSVRYLMFNRMASNLMPPYYTAGPAQQMGARAMAPIKRLFWSTIESVILRKFQITEQMRPRVQLPTDLFYGGQILDNSMDKLIRGDVITTVKGEINRFVRNGVILQDGNFVAADLVLYCTGYLKTYEYLEGDMRAKLDLQKDGLYLYRNCLPYAVPHLAFVGSEVSTYNNILTDGLQALWLANVLGGRVKLPPPTLMAEDVRAQQRWRRAVMPAQRSRGSVLMLYMMQYHDQLLEDVGAATRRKGLNALAECCGSYTAEDYTPLLKGDSPIIPGLVGAEELAAAGLQPAALAAGRGSRREQGGGGGGMPGLGAGGGSGGGFGNSHGHPYGNGNGNSTANGYSNGSSGNHPGSALYGSGSGGPYSNSTGVAPGAASAAAPVDVCCTHGHSRLYRHSRGATQYKGGSGSGYNGYEADHGSPTQHHPRSLRSHSNPLHRGSRGQPSTPAASSGGGRRHSGDSPTAQPDTGSAAAACGACGGTSTCDGCHCAGRPYGVPGIGPASMRRYGSHPQNLAGGAMAASSLPSPGGPLSSSAVGASGSGGRGGAASTGAYAGRRSSCSSELPVLSAHGRSTDVSGESFGLDAAPAGFPSPSARQSHSSRGRRCRTASGLAAVAAASHAAAAAALGGAASAGGGQSAPQGAEWGPPAYPHASHPYAHSPPQGRHPGLPYGPGAHHNHVPGPYGPGPAHVGPTHLGPSQHVGGACPPLPPHPHPHLHAQHLPSHPPRPRSPKHGSPRGGRPVGITDPAYGGSCGGGTDGSLGADGSPSGSHRQRSSPHMPAVFTPPLAIVTGGGGDSTACFCQSPQDRTGGCACGPASPTAVAVAGGGGGRSKEPSPRFQPLASPSRLCRRGAPEAEAGPEEETLSSALRMTPVSGLPSGGPLLSSGGGVNSTCGGGSTGGGGMGGIGVRLADAVSALGLPARGSSAPDHPCAAVDVLSPADGAASGNGGSGSPTTASEEEAFRRGNGAALAATIGGGGVSPYEGPGGVGRPQNLSLDERRRPPAAAAVPAAPGLSEVRERPLTAAELAAAAVDAVSALALTVTSVSDPSHVLSGASHASTRRASVCSGSGVLDSTDSFAAASRQRLQPPPPPSALQDAADVPSPWTSAAAPQEEEEEEAGSQPTHTAPTHIPTHIAAATHEPPRSASLAAWQRSSTTAGSTGSAASGAAAAAAAAVARQQSYGRSPQPDEQFSVAVRTPSGTGGGAAISVGAAAAVVATASYDEELSAFDIPMRMRQSSAGRGPSTSGVSSYSTGASDGGSGGGGGAVSATAANRGSLDFTASGGRMLTSPTLLPPAAAAGAVCAAASPPPPFAAASGSWVAASRSRGSPTEVPQRVTLTQLSQPRRSGSGAASGLSGPAADPGNEPGSLLSTQQLGGPSSSAFARAADVPYSGAATDAMTSFGTTISLAAGFATLASSPMGPSPTAPATSRTGSGGLLQPPALPSLPTLPSNAFPTPPLLVRTATAEAVASPGTASHNYTLALWGPSGGGVGTLLTGGGGGHSSVATGDSGFGGLLSNPCHSGEYDCAHVDMASPVVSGSFAMPYRHGEPEAAAAEAVGREALASALAARGGVAVPIGLDAFGPRT
ncbi:hypothetical protein HYH03_006500 [Edaphochlamys debaryana]|uniref:Flavin-containing monooxygenase n=1 Tax=Edaphochlamys debaryana TaxID=47281 RepID=A0A835Y3E6_9CHLO|nr:hypothetical protein HYH03_006500 [Edaphochlamys debaryana]|eukprot:KAG2495226.1 hypothetical protein HYH03_006500 [Edaphochlamys debaryana]